MNNIFYMTAWSKEDPKAGVYSCTFENKEVKIHGFEPLFMAGYLCFSPNGKFLYATGCNDKGEEDLTAFALEENGSMKRLSSVSSGGVSTCHNCVSPDGKFLYAANYSSGDFAEFELSTDGSIIKRTKLVSHHGSGPVKGRQESAHPHFTAMTPDGRFVVVADLGIDKLVCYPYDSSAGINEKAAVESVMPSGCGPRHIHFASCGKIAYLLTELGNTILSMHYENGRFTIIDEISLLPEKCNCVTKASAIRMSEDGRFLVGTNRGFDSIVMIEVDGRGGMKINQTTLSGGNSPRDVNFLPDGEHFAAANEFSDNIYFYDYDREKGTIAPNGVKLEYPRPLCIAWWKK